MFDAAALERIQTQARDIDPVKVAVGIVAAIPYVLGWVVAKVFTVVWIVISWAAAAAMVGWTDARKGQKPVTLRSGWGGGNA